MKLNNIIADYNKLLEYKTRKKDDIIKTSVVEISSLC